MTNFIKVLLFSFFTFSLTAEILIHEAYITRIREVEPLLAISEAIPSEKNEKVPTQQENEYVWIPGYWSWDMQNHHYVWVNGIWRRPPPGKEWIAGKWMQKNDNWFWLSGFWKDKGINEILFLQSPPPDLTEDSIEKPKSTEYFWIPGHYVNENESYKWEKGFWETFDRNWVFTPGYYSWRPEGYFYVKEFWDWPIESRGVIYSNVEKEQLLSTNSIIETLFLSYPDYLTFFEHYNHFYSKLTDSPPWWEWQTWWTYNWSNQWKLWWWYTHQGYSQPKWITLEIAKSMIPPSPSLKQKITFTQPPLIVTPYTVISSKRAAKEVKKMYPSLFNILPLDKYGDFQKVFLKRKKERVQAIAPIGKKNIVLERSSKKIVKNSRDAIKPFIEKIKSKITDYQDLAVDNSITPMQRDWEEEIREREIKRNRAWSERKKAFKEDSMRAIEDWNQSIRIRNSERESYGEETIRHKQESMEKQEFWQPQIDARELQRQEEQKAIKERRLENELSLSDEDKRYWMKRDAIRSDNLRYLRNLEDSKQDAKRHMQMQELIKKEQLQRSQKEQEKKKEDEIFWQEVEKLKKERGDISLNNYVKEREEQLKDDEAFWDEAEKQKETSRKKIYDVQPDIKKYGPPLPQNKDIIN